MLEFSLVNWGKSQLVLGAKSAKGAKGEIAKSTTTEHVNNKSKGAMNNWCLTRKINSKLLHKGSHVLCNY